MGWKVPPLDAVSLGEMDGELISITPRDDRHLGDEYVRRGGTIFPPARVVCQTNIRRTLQQPFGQQESLTDDFQGRNDSQAMQLIKKSVSIVQTMFFDDEEKAWHAMRSTLQSIGKHVLRQSSPEVDEEATEYDQRVEDEWEVRDASRAIDRNAVIRAMSWHPTLSTLAVAQRDGIVAFYHVQTATWDTRVLEHASQTDITCIEWANFAGGKLAVASRGGIFLWKLAMKHQKEAPVLSDTIKLAGNVVCDGLAWNESGTILAAFSKERNVIYIIDTVYARTTQLTCGNTITSLRWSPSGEYLFATTDGEVSLMWETCTWHKETWDLQSEACVWSKNGKCLVVAQRNNSMLYPYSFQSTPPAMDAQMTAPAIDFSTKSIRTLDGQATELIGGRVLEMAWDPSGARLAVTFASSTTTALSGETMGTMVAIFSVSWKPYLIFTRRGLLRGPPNAGVPLKLAFASHCKRGALLSVAWSNGLVSFYPFYFDQEQENLLAS